MSDMLERLGYLWGLSHDPKAVFIIQNGLKVGASKEEILDALRAEKDMSEEYYHAYLQQKERCMKLAVDGPSGTSKSDAEMEEEKEQD
jgi:hypothetical protein